MDNTDVVPETPDLADPRTVRLAVLEQLCREGSPSPPRNAAELAEAVVLIADAVMTGAVIPAAAPPPTVGTAPPTASRRDAAIEAAAAILARHIDGAHWAIGHGTGLDAEDIAREVVDAIVALPAAPAAFWACS